MDADLNRRLVYELKLLNYDRNQYAQRLTLCNGLERVLLRKTDRPNGKSYYYAKHEGSDTYKYIGNKDKSDAARIIEAHFLRESILRIDKDIRLINSFIKDYLPVDPHSVNASLPEVYRSDVLPISPAYQSEGSAWKARQLSFQKEFPENYPEYKTEQTSDGVMVKTISEVVLYERFKAAGFFEIYELPLVLPDHGPNMYPDFTILSPIDAKTEIIVEYVGRLDLPKYREDFARKVGRYIANGYKPGVDLFFIFSDKNGHIDSQQINRVIADIRGI